MGILKIKNKKEKAFDSGNSELFEFINDKINFLMFSKFGISNSDNQNRILIPPMVREMYELKDKVLYVMVKVILKYLMVLKNMKNMRKTCE